MKTALVIPVRNALSCGKWPEVLAAVSAQTRLPERKIVIDSESEDSACAMAEACGWECWKICRKKFNHGKTRDRALRKLAAEGMDTVIFLSQDVILDSPDALEKLTDFLWAHPVAGCYGRQISRQENSLNHWQQSRCYPEKSAVRTREDLPRLGFMTSFFSHAFAAWKTAEVLRYGGFPEADFGEDMLFAASVLKQNGAVGYCAEAVARHEHPHTMKSLFFRGFLVGNFHRRHAKMLREFGKGKNSLFHALPFSLWLPFLAKSAGYAIGRYGERLLPLGLFLLMWLLLIPAIFFYDFPQRDVAVRYAPMAEAFADGDWAFAFHPRITPLLPVVAGILAALFSCGGYPACQLAASLLLTLGIFPLHAGCRKIYGEKSALCAALLYALASPFLRLGYYGLRETGSILGVVTLFFAAALLREKPEKFRGYLIFAAGEFLLLSSRGDVAAFALLMALVLFFWEICRRRFPWRSMAAGAVLLAMLSPLLYYNWRMSGYPVPEIRHAMLCRKICRKFPALRKLENPHPQMPLEGKEGGKRP